MVAKKTGGTSSFLIASAVFSVINLAASAVAFVIIALVSRKGGGLITDWTALNNLITILLTITAGFSMYYSKTISRLASKNISMTISYLTDSERYLIKLLKTKGWVLVVIVLALAAFLKFLNWYQAILIAVLVVVELWSVIYRMYFLGRFEYVRAMILTLFSAVTRFVGIVAFLEWGLGIDSLLIGSVIGGIASVIVAKWYVVTSQRSEKKEFVVHSNTLETDFASSIQASLALIIVSLLLQSGSIVTQGFYLGEQKTTENIAFLSQFANILYYGASSFLALFVVNATRSSSTQIYTKGVGIITGVTIIGTIAVAILWPVALWVLNRPHLTFLLPYFLCFSIFVVCYNTIVVGVQFLISQYRYADIWKIGRGIAVFVSSLTLFALVPVGIDYTTGFIALHLIFGPVLAWYTYRLVVDNSTAL